MNAATSTTNARSREGLEVPGLGAFVNLDGAAKSFKKDVLKVWSGVHPGTGRQLSFDAPFLDRLVENTNRWLGLGNKVWCPTAGPETVCHNADSRLNLGYWKNFRREGELIAADLEVFDELTAGKVGKTIRDVSVGLHYGAKASSGEVFEAVIEHVAVTPEPVIPGQGNFTALSRDLEGPAPKETSMEIKPAADQVVAAAKVELSTDAAAAETVSADTARKALALGFGLSSDASWSDVVGASAQGGGVFMARATEKAEKALGDNYGKQIAALQKRYASSVVELARDESARAGSPIAKEVLDEAQELLSSGVEREEKLGKRLLELAKRPTSSAGLVTLANPGQKGTENTEVNLARNESLKKMFRSQGIKFELDKAGKPVATPRAAAK